MKDAVRPARQCLDAIKNFPVPKNISSLRSFYGMINQINNAFLMTEHMEPLWSPILQEKYEMAKQMIVDTVMEGVEGFDFNRHRLLFDAEILFI